MRHRVYLSDCGTDPFKVRQRSAQSSAGVRDNREPLRVRLGRNVEREVKYRCVDYASFVSAELPTVRHPPVQRVGIKHSALRFARKEDAICGAHLGKNEGWSPAESWWGLLAEECLPMLPINHT